MNSGPVPYLFVNIRPVASWETFMRVHLLVVTLAGAVVGGLAPSSTRAAIVFSSFGPGTGYLNNFLYPLVNPTVGERLGWRFSPSASGELDAVSAAVGKRRNQVVVGTFELYEDASGNPGMLMGTLSGPLGFSGAISTFHPDTRISVEAGRPYFMVFVSPVEGGANWYVTNDSSFSGIQCYKPAGDAPWGIESPRPFGAFSVSIPAPSAAAAFALLAFTLPVRRGRAV